MGKVGLLKRVMDGSARLSFKALATDVEGGFRYRLKSGGLFFDCFKSRSRTGRLRGVLAPSSNGSVAMAVFRGRGRAPPVRAAARTGPGRIAALVLSGARSILG